MNTTQGRGDLLLRDLEGAVQDDQIVALFQPQFDLATAEIVSAESLSRWTHPELGTISPVEFIPLAEQTDLISEIGNRMVVLAATAAAKWQTQRPGFQVAVNVSMLQLRSDSFSADFLGVLAAASVAPGLIIAELTESTALDDVAGAGRLLLDLAAEGVVISVDDFGSGNATRAQVEALPATELKIDLHVVQDMTDVGAAKLADFIRFGKEHGMRVVAEGVETSEQLERVRALGCDRAQGYLLGHPVTAPELTARLAHAS